MYLSIEHNSGVSVSAQVIDQIKYKVVSGALQPGERIPSVRMLARQLKLNPTTVARISPTLCSIVEQDPEFGLGSFWSGALTSSPPFWVS